MAPQRSFWRRSWSMLSCLVLAALLLSPALTRPATVHAQSINGPWTYTPVVNPSTGISGAVNWYAQYQPYLSIPNRGCFKLVFTAPPPPPGGTVYPSTVYVPATITYGSADENFAFYTDYVDSPYWGPIHRSNGLTVATDDKGANWGGFIMKAGTSMTITRVNSIPNKPQHTCTEGYTGADLSTELSISRSTQPVGTQFTTTVHLGNRASTAASNARVALTLGSGLVIDAATPSAGTYSGGVWTLSSLAAGQKTTLTLTMRVASGTPGTLLGVNASASSSTTELNNADNAKQYNILIGKPGAPGGAPKAGDPCPRGSRARSFTGQIDAEGQPVNTWWQKFFRRPVAQVTMTWGGLCFNDDGSINTTITKSSAYTVSVVGRNGWSAVTTSTTPTCSFTASLTECRHFIRLTPPSSETLNVSFDIGANLHTYGTRFGLSYTGTSSTTQANIPVGTIIRARGETYTAGAGDQPLSGSVGDY